VTTLKLGSQGPEVVELQNLLGIVADGDFGAKTQSAVKAFQVAHGLQCDGVVGDETWNALLTPPTSPGLNAATLLTVSKLHLTIQEPAISFLQDALHAAGLHLAVTQGLRTMKEQAALYAQGRTTPGPIVTNAPPGSSWHNFGLAFDVALIQDGKLSWPNDENLWLRIGLIGEAHGLEWGGRWKTIVDRPHFQRVQGLTLAQARAGMRPES
jgi:hypothetical protein